MSHDLHTPAAAQSKRRASRYVMALTSAAFISGVIALPATAATAPAGRPAATDVSSAAEPCPPGYVWRDKWDGDALCVTPAERQRVHDQNPNRQPGGGVYGPSTCKQGYVWREKWDGDTLCVTPAERQRVHDQNPNRQPGGGVYGPSTCKQGYVWREKWDGDTLCVTPAERDRVRGQGRLIDNGPNLIGIPGE